MLFCILVLISYTSICFFGVQTYKYAKIYICIERDLQICKIARHLAGIMLLILPENQKEPTTAREHSKEFRIGEVVFDNSTHEPSFLCPLVGLYTIYYIYIYIYIYILASILKSACISGSVYSYVLL